MFLSNQSIVINSMKKYIVYRTEILGIVFNGFHIDIVSIPIHLSHCSLQLINPIIPELVERTIRNESERQQAITHLVDWLLEKRLLYFNIISNNS